MSSIAVVANKTAALEEKIDGIVKMLLLNQGSSSQASPGQSLNSIDFRRDSESQNTVRYENVHSNPEKGSIPPSRDRALLYELGQKGTSYGSNRELATSLATRASTVTDASSYSRSPNASHSSTLYDYPFESEEECEEYLEIYRSKMINFFPAVIVEQTVKATELREERPFLWLVIKAICTKNSARQVALGLEVRRTLGEKILIEGAKSLDLLLGLLVFTAWGHYFLCKSPIVSSTIHLATSIASDLGLTRKVQSESVGSGSMLHFSSQGCPRPPIGIQNPHRTMEERRAILGLFLISSM